MAWPPQPNNRIPGRVDGTADPDRRGGADCSDQASHDTDDALARFASDARVEERVAERRRQRWLERQAVESSSFEGLLLTLAEIGRTITVRTVAGTTHRGVLRIVGHDCLVLSPPQPAPHRLVVINLTHVIGVSATSTPHLTGERDDIDPAARAGLQQLLAELAEDQPQVRVGLTDASNAVGRLAWVGVDVVAITLDERDPRELYVRLSSVVDVSLSASG